VNSNCFKRLLIELDHVAAAQNSVINHHVEGMEYLCLHRSEKLTVKLYFIDPTNIARPENSYLVTPHTHRYSFESTVLAGRLQHLTFRQCTGSRYDVSEYSPETRSRSELGECDLEIRSRDVHGVDSSYWCGTSDIHTLIVPDDPVLLGLVQFSDITAKSTVYLRKGSRMDYPQSRKPTADEALSLRNRALEMLETA
jgi:hypothetical protein